PPGNNLSTRRSVSDGIWNTMRRLVFALIPLCLNNSIASSGNSCIKVSNNTDAGRSLKFPAHHGIYPDLTQKNRTFFKFIFRMEFRASLVSDSFGSPSTTDLSVISFSLCVLYKLVRPLKRDK